MNADPVAGIADLHARFAAGTLTVVDAVRRALEASSAPEHAEAWIHRVSEDEVLETARRMQVALDAVGEPGAPRRLPPLFGVPFAVKDNIDVAGLPTTAACPGFAHVAETSAPAVKRLLDAGAICLGKTNLDQFATGLVGTRSPYGACRNPYDPDYITGGSSSGSALAVATGMVTFALGTDTAGSGRVPAAFCNLTGVKPTRGLVSARGVVPACPSLDCVTVFAREASDAFAVLHVLEGFDDADPWSRRKPQGRMSATTDPFPASFRFAVARAGQLDFEGDAESARLYANAVERLRARGGTPVPVDITPLLECARLLYSGPWLAERAQAVIGPGTFGAAHPEALLPLLREILEPARGMTAMEAFAGLDTLARLRRASEGILDAADLLLLPTTPTIYTHAQIAEEPLARNAVLGRFTNFVNLLDLAAVALPAGFRADGLPFGVTLLAPAFHEDILEAAAARWSGHSAPSPYLPPKSTAPDRVSLLVFGLHLSGMRLNGELTSLGARLERTARTSPQYRMALLRRGEIRLPGVWRQAGRTGVPLEGEVWSLPAEALGTFFGGVPAPLALGTIELEDGSHVKGFLAEASACEAAEDISRYGSWREWVEGQQ